MMDEFARLHYMKTKPEKRLYAYRVCDSDKKILVHMTWIRREDGDHF